ncbi:hypothetical protein [Rathayibacter toxicus]|uniref:hypothetical protein n=1 Tax=Rathayibacter toxicus TaxID=145458 RepID=UPI001C03FC04|nr:hypothetical protein [Rathayibacter toxicus]QWL30042.1 hypothetical protein E2R34_04255 [Rathayibacter toxicus]
MSIPGSRLRGRGAVTTEVENQPVDATGFLAFRELCRHFISEQIAPKLSHQSHSINTITGTKCNMPGLVSHTAYFSEIILYILSDLAPVFGTKDVHMRIYFVTNIDA